jgi:hypothetical protein
MSIRYTTKARRGMAAAAIAVGLALAVAGCGGDEEPKNETNGTASSASKGNGSNKDKQSEEPTETLAVLKGQEGLELTLNSAKRDSGGFLTVTGVLKNTSDDLVVLPPAMRGDETEIVKHDTSFGGATLVDSVGKKRYYVLRDTEGRPLTTIGLDDLAAGAHTSVFLQFPAPPSTTTEVNFQLPTFRPGTIKLSK